MKAIASAEDVATAVAELTVRFKAEEGRRRAISEIRKRSDEEPREPTDDEIAVAVAATPDYPVFTISKKHFDAQSCTCLRYREAGKCDCKQVI